MVGLIPSRRHNSDTSTLACIPASTIRSFSVAVHRRRFSLMVGPPGFATSLPPWRRPPTTLAPVPLPLKHYTSPHRVVAHILAQFLPSRPARSSGVCRSGGLDVVAEV